VKRGQFPRGYQFLIVNLAVQITYILINQIGEGEIDRERERQNRGGVDGCKEGNTRCCSLGHKMLKIRQPEKKLNILIGNSNDDVACGKWKGKGGKERGRGKGVCVCVS